jgi:hypothetical protein
MASATAAVDPGTRPGSPGRDAPPCCAIVISASSRGPIRSAADPVRATGEVTRYLSSYGSARVAKGVLVSPIPPFLLQTPDNPDGVPQSLFDGFAQAARADTPAWMKGFLDNFYNWTRPASGCPA